jgi:hypothetical protein
MKVEGMSITTILRSADQSVPHQHILLTRSSLLLIVEIWFNNKNFFNDLRCISVYRKEWYSFITLTVEDEMQFAVGIRLLYAYTVCYTDLHQLYCKCKKFWEMPLKRNRVLESDSVKKSHADRQTDKQWSDNA